MKFKKLLAGILAAVTFALTAAMTVSAESIFDIAKNIDSGKKITKTLDDKESMNYKFTPTKKGTATLKFTVKAKYFSVYVYDEDGESIDYKKNITMGTTGWSFKELEWNSNAETFKGTVTFDVKANKTYYVKIERSTSVGSGKFEVSFKYPTGEAEETALMTVTLKKGDTLQLGANGSSAKWSTSNKAAATVSSSGLVKAVKKGKAVITLKCGSQSQKIEIVVE